jgi:hypothetical protein
MDSVDQVVEKEFQFCFRHFNLFSLATFYVSLQDIGGSIEMENEDGMRWRSPDRPGVLLKHFAQPLVIHTARIRGSEEQCEAYMDVFDMHSGYITYFNAPLVER